MTAVVAFLKLASSAIWRFLSSLSLWQAIALGLAIFAAIQHFQLLDARHDAAKWQKHALEYKAQIDQADAAVRKARDTINQISKELKDRTDEENRRIAGDANSLRVSGPGKAVCRPAPAPSGGHGATPANPDAPGPALPPDDRAAVPWGWLVNRGQEHNQLRTEVQAWRDWYAQLVRNWPKQPNK